MTSDRTTTTQAPTDDRPAPQSRPRGAATLTRTALFAAAAMVATYANAAEDLNSLESHARAVLEEHCSRCHQDGMLKEGIDRPQGKFGFILDLERVVKKRLVIPGNSSGSAIMRQIENGSMPKDMSSDCYLYPPPDDAYCGPTSDEVAALRSWIDALNNPELQLAAATVPAGDGGAAAPAESSGETPDEGAAEETASDESTSGGGGSLAEAIAEQAAEAAGSEETAPAEAVVSEVPAEPEPVFFTDEEMIRTMALDLAEVPEARRESMRYITLWHLKNAGDEEEALDVYRLAVTKLLNSLSRKSNPVIPVVVDEAQTILRFNMQDLGWTASLWDKIAAANPYLMKYDDAMYDTLVDNTNSKMPFVRADWFAFVASQPPLYYDLLGLPDTKEELYKLLGVDAIADIDALDVQRAGFRHSGVSTNNRMIERHEMATGAFWESYDFAGNAGRRDFFQFPVGPQAAFDDMGEEHGFKEDGGEIIFNLPNGFHAYYLAKGTGERLDRGPTEIVRDDSRRDASVTNGISCMGCHDAGIKYNPYRDPEALDEVRDIVLANITVPKEVRETVEEIYSPHEEFYQTMQSDAEDYEKALAAAGINMRVKYDGLEMVNALFARFEEDVTARLAAAEFGLTEEEFFERLGIAGGDAYTLKIRLTQDRIPRDQFVKEYADLARQITDNEPVEFEEATAASEDVVVVSEARPADAAKTFDLSFVPTTETYSVGGDVTFTVKSAKPCFLTLVNVDESDAVQIVFPNKFNDENAIEADREYTIPSDEIGGFKFVFSDPGKEKVIAICNASRPTPRGIVHDFENSAYTTFRSLDDFTRSRLLSVEPSDGKAITGEGESEATPLVENTVDPEVDIVAQKAVVLLVEGEAAASTEEPAAETAQ